MLRSILAIIVGFLLWTALWLGSNALLTSVFPQWYGSEGQALSTTPLIFGLIDTILFSLLAGYLTTRIANKMRPVWILSIIQFAIGLLVTILFRETAPLWYHSLFLLVLIPSHLLGGYLSHKSSSS